MYNGNDLLPRLSGARRQTSDDWDNRFYLSHIPLYDARSDPHIRRSKGTSMTAFQLTRLMKTRPGSKLAPLSRGVSRTKSRDALARTRSNPKARETEEEADLYGRLNAAWTTWNVSAAQRLDFQKSVLLKTKPLTELMKEELARLEAEHHPSHLVEKAINRREGLLTELQGFLPLGDGSEKQLEAAELLADLRVASLEVVESVLRWRDATQSISAYKWQGRSYFAKMKQDTEFLQAFDPWFYISEDSDPFLLSAAGARTFTKQFPKFRKNDQRIPLPLLGNELPRIKQADLLLHADREDFKAELLVQESRRKSPRKSVVPVLVATQHTHTFQDEAPSLSSSTVQTPVWRLEDLATALLTAFVTDVVETTLPEVLRESCKDVIAASLTLYSSNILDRLIILALETEIPICARESYNEELDREYIAFQLEIIEMAVNTEVQKWAYIWVRDVIAEEITRTYARLVPVEEVVQESIAEETQLNSNLMVLLYADLLEVYISQEWLEILCENEFSEAILEDRYRELPANVVQKLRKDNPSKEAQRLSEEFYRDLLAAYVGGLWLSQLVAAVLSGKEEGAEGDLLTFAFEIVVPKRPSQGLMSRLYAS